MPLKVNNSQTLDVVFCRSLMLLLVYVLLYLRHEQHCCSWYCVSTRIFSLHHYTIRMERGHHRRVSCASTVKITISIIHEARDGRNDPTTRVPEPPPSCAYVLRYRLIASRWAADDMTLKNISVTALAPLINPGNVAGY